MKHVMPCLLLTLSAAAQIATFPAPSSAQWEDRALKSPESVLAPASFEYRGIRIGDPIAVAERTFLAWKVASPSAKPGLCGSDGVKRIETCTDVLDTGEYVNMTLLDRKVAQIYVSTDGRAEGSTYIGYVLALKRKYGSPDSPATSQNATDRANELPEERLRWSNGGQYIKANLMERSIVIGSDLLDSEVDALEKSQ